MSERRQEPTAREGPLCSVIVANHNYARFLVSMITSVRRQTYSNWELIVCDDGSTDASVHVLQEWHVKEPRLQIILQSNGGMASAWNRCVAASRGDIVCVLDADDEMHPERLREIVDAFEGVPEAGLCTHLVTPVDSHGTSCGRDLPRRLDSGWVGDQLLGAGGRGAMPPASGLALRREIAERVFPCPVRLRRCADGYVANAAALISPIVCIRRSLALYRLHGSNLTGLNDVSLKGIATLLQDFEVIAETLTEFVRREQGGNEADRLRVSHSPAYMEASLAKRLLESSLDVKTFFEAASGLRSGVRRALWFTMALVPPFIGRAILRAWWGNSTPKRWILAASSLTPR